MSKIILTSDQDKVVRDILNFSTSNLRTMSLIGAAGTGKTTVLREVVKHLPYHESLICIAAPTHRAKTVAARGLGNIERMTIAAAIGMLPDVNNEEFDAINNNLFEKLADSRMHKYAFFPIDEASQIPHWMFEHIKSAAMIGRTKTLFLGDGYQLPPVSNDIRDIVSPFSNEGMVDAISLLTTPIRQKPTNPTGVLLLALRYGISKSIKDKGYLMTALEQESWFDIYNEINACEPERCFSTILKLKPIFINEDDEGYKVHTSFTTFIDDMMSEELPIRVMAYTNDQVIGYNKVIHRDKFKRTSVVDVGDILIGYNTIQKKEGKDMNTVINNSEEYIVRECKVEDNHHFDFSDSNKTMKKFPSYHKVFNVTLEDSSGFASCVNILHPDSYKMFTQDHLNRLSIARKYKGQWWNPYFHFCTEYITMDIMEGKDSPKRGLDYFYAMTCHKAQGSTFPVVFVDVPNIRQCYHHYYSHLGNTEFRNNAAREYMLRMLYVACSRSSMKLHLFIP